MSYANQPRDGEAPLYRLAHDVRSACSNIHNVDGAPGRAGAEVRVPQLQPGERVILAKLDGPAVITRFWLTFDWPDRFHYAGSMLRNRSVTLEITWDDADMPAISVPVADFFCHPLGYDIPFENAWFADPVGRSSLCFLPMPFRSHATVAIVNHFDRPVIVFHDIRFLRGIEPDPDDGYLHACFQRTMPTAPGARHDILPRVRGRGRYLGTHLGIITDRYNPMDWHGGNIAFYLDGDSEYPSMLGASLDDYAGSAWLYEQRYMHQDSGLLLSRDFPEGGGHYGLYVYHRRDPLLFESSCAVSITPAVHVRAGALLSLLRQQPELTERLAIPHDLSILEGMVQAGEDAYFNCGRLDDLSTLAFYYLDRPDGAQPSCTPDTCIAPAWQWPVSDEETME